MIEKKKPKDYFVTYKHLTFKFHSKLYGSMVICLQFLLIAFLLLLNSVTETVCPAETKAVTFWSSQETRFF